MAHYICQNCKKRYARLYVECPNCFARNTIFPDTSLVLEDLRRDTSSPLLSNQTKIREVTRYPIGLPSIDRMLGGGLYAGLKVLLIARKGTGKTTLAHRFGHAVSQNGGGATLYTGEMSERQNRVYLEKNGIPQDAIRFVETNSTHEIVDDIRNFRPALGIIDSLQVMSSGKIGRPSWSEQADFSVELGEIAKRYRTIILALNQTNHDGSAAGPENVPHNYDVPLEMKRGENDEIIISSYGLKNREADPSLRAVLRMTKRGIVEKHEIETGHILRHLDDFVEGNAAFPAIKEKEIIVDELNAVVCRSEGFSLSIDAAGTTTKVFLQGVLEHLVPEIEGDYALRANRVTKWDRSGDLAVVMAVLSRYYRTALPIRIAFGSGIDGNGHLIHVPDLRLKTDRAIAMGYEAVIGPRAIGSETPNWIQCDTLLDVVEYLERQMGVWAKVRARLALPSK